MQTLFDEGYDVPDGRLLRLRREPPNPADALAAPPCGPARRRWRDLITRELIVETALRLLDRDGLDQLSMRRIADELDTGAASLYWHVGSKDGIVHCFDRVIGAGDSRPRAGTLGGAAEGSGANSARDDPAPPGYRQDLHRADPHGPERAPHNRAPLRNSACRRRP